MAPLRDLLDHLIGGLLHDSGTLRPSALALLRLSNNSKQHNGQRARVLALKDPSHVIAGLAIRVRSACALTDQSTGFDLLAIGVDRGNAMACCKRDDFVAVIEEQGIGGDKVRTNPSLHDGSECFIDMGLSGGIENAGFLAKRPRRGRYLYPLQLARRVVRVREHSKLRRLGDQLAQTIPAVLTPAGT